MEIQRSPANRPETGKEAGRLAKRINLVWAGAEILAFGDQRTLADLNEAAAAADASAYS